MSGEPTVHARVTRRFGAVIDTAPLDSGCEYTLTHELHPDWADYADRTRNARSGMLDEIAALVP